MKPVCECQSGFETVNSKSQALRYYSTPLLIFLIFHCGYSKTEYARQSYLRGQGSSLQGSSKILSPSQTLPPYCGEGLSQNLNRTRVPPLQTREQIVQPDHAPQLPSRDLPTDKEYEEPQHENFYDEKYVKTFFCATKKGLRESINFNHSGYHGRKQLKALLLSSPLPPPSPGWDASPSTWLPAALTRLPPFCKYKCHIAFVNVLDH